MHSIILASASPRRADLLRQIGLPFVVKPVNIDETPGTDEAPARYVERLAREKALAAGIPGEGVLVIGSDTSVVLGGRILGKPANHEEAFTMLEALSGNTHQVMTAVAVASRDGCQTRLVATDVSFRSLGAEEISAYIATGEPMDKAGSYGVQGLGGVFVEQLRGSYSSVVGLPLNETATLLAEAGFPVWQAWNRGKESQDE